MTDSSAAPNGDLDALLGPAGLFAQRMPGYEHRAAQLELARAVDRTLVRDGVLLAEAGTGTGKTLAYLVPAMLSGKKVVVSTGTRTLQDQIVEHDLPLLERTLGWKPEVACMKGLNNYLCLRRYEELRTSAAAMLPRIHRQLPVLETFVAQSETGDRKELELPEEAAIWAEVQSGAETRIGPKCRYYDACFATRMRERAERAQLVIVNHHLFFADLALRGRGPGGVIPEYEAVIFDEAHLIEDVATDFFGVQVSSTRLAVLLRDAARAFEAAKLMRECESLLRDAEFRGQEFFAALPRATGAEGGRTPLDASTFGASAQRTMFALDNALDALASFCKRKVELSEAVLQLARRADQLRDDIATIADGIGSARVCYAQSRGKSMSLCASPVSVADNLREHLFERGGGIVLTSATLAADGSFEFLRSRLGIGEADELVLSSPFDFQAQAALYLPSDVPEPRAPEYLDAAEREIARLIALTDGGALVLCTSYRVMRALCERLRPQLERTVLMQGEAPNPVLLERFRHDGRAVLLATASFWQGVDVPGAALRLVIIDKLPFDVPSDPLIAARCERLKQEGVQPFMKYLVPAAALTLKQGFGRLIRSRRDLGIVAILDSRVTRKSYGRTLLRSLPPATRCYSFAEVAQFWRQVLSPRAARAALAPPAEPSGPHSHASVPHAGSRRSAAEPKS